MDLDLIVPLQKTLTALFKQIDLQSRVISLNNKTDCVEAQLENADGKTTLQFDRTLVANGRKPVSNDLGLEKLEIETDDHGFIETNEQQITTADHVFAVGDVCGKPLLAHTAIRQGRVAAEAASGLSAA